MADITARIVWYKLTEKYSDVCEKYDRFLDWYEDFSWSRVDFLDMLFLGWLLAAFMVVGAINLYLRFFAHPRSKRGVTGGGVSPLHGESVTWLNNILSWLFHHYSHTPDFVEAWLIAVNEQLKKQQYEYQIKVDSVQTGSPPPKISLVSTDTSTKDCLTVHCGVETPAETRLLVSAIQQSPTNIRVTNCDVVILKLKGQLKLQSIYKSGQDQIEVSLCFTSSPDLSLQVRPRQIDSKVKLKVVEDALKSSISSSVTTFTVPSTGGYPNFYPGLIALSSDASHLQKRTTVTPVAAPVPAKSTAQDFTAAVREPSSSTESPVPTTSTTLNEPTIPPPKPATAHLYEPLNIDVTKYETVKNEQLLHAGVVGNGSVSARQPATAKGKKSSLLSESTTNAKPREGISNAVGLSPTSYHSYQPQRDYYREKVHLLGPVPSKYVSFDSKVSGATNPAKINATMSLGRKGTSASVPELASPEKYKLRQSGANSVSNSLEGLVSCNVRSGVSVQQDRNFDQGKDLEGRREKKKEQKVLNNTGRTKAVTAEYQGSKERSDLVSDLKDDLGQFNVDMVKQDKLPSRVNVTMVNFCPEDRGKQQDVNQVVAENITYKIRSKTYPEKKSEKASWFETKDKSRKTDSLNPGLSGGTSESRNENELFPLQRSNSWNSSQQEDKETLKFYFKAGNPLQKSSSFNSKDKKVHKRASSPTVKQLIQDVEEPPYFYTKDFKKKMAFLKHYDLRGHEQVMSELEYRLRAHYLSKNFPRVRQDYSDQTDDDVERSEILPNDGELPVASTREDIDTETNGQHKEGSALDDVVDTKSKDNWCVVDNEQYFSDITSFLKMVRLDSNDDGLEQTTNKGIGKGSTDKEDLCSMMPSIPGDKADRSTENSMRDVEEKMHGNGGDLGLEGSFQEPEDADKSYVRSYEGFQGPEDADKSYVRSNEGFQKPDDVDRSCERSYEACQEPEKVGQSYPVSEMTAERLAKVKSQVLAHMKRDSLEKKEKKVDTETPPPVGEFRYGSYGLVLDEYEEEPGSKRRGQQVQRKEEAGTLEYVDDMKRDILSESGVYSMIEEQQVLEKNHGEAMTVDRVERPTFKSEMHFKNPILEPKIYSSPSTTTSASFVREANHQSTRSLVSGGVGGQSVELEEGNRDKDQKTSQKDLTERPIEKRSTKKKGKKSKDGKKRSKKVSKSVSFQHQHTFPQREAYLKLCGMEPGPEGMDKENLHFGDTLVYHSDIRENPSIPNIFRTRSLPNTYDINPAGSSSSMMSKAQSDSPPVEGSFDSVFEVKNPTDDFKSRVLSMEGSPKVYKSRRVTGGETTKVAKVANKTGKKKRKKHDKKKMTSSAPGGEEEDTSSLASSSLGSRDVGSLVSIAAVLNDSAVCAFMQGADEHHYYNHNLHQHPHPPSMPGAGAGVGLEQLGYDPPAYLLHQESSFLHHNQYAASPGGTLRHRKLLVKVIKANGLGDKDFGCSGPYCTVQAEEPQQRYITSVVKNTVNPFWDEHFVFDLNDNTKNIKFEVFDREKTPGTDFLGRAVIPMNELKRLPSSRQIVPLTGKPGTTTTSGSVTVEFLFMESPESQQPFVNTNKSDLDGISPRRRIETNRTVTPGGTLVTTTTTTTERPREAGETAYNDILETSPSKIEKSDTSSSYTAEYSPYSSRSSHLGAHEAGLTASQQELVQLNGTEPLTETALRNLKESREREQRNISRQSSRASQSTLIITGTVATQRDQAIPTIQTPDQNKQDQKRESRKTQQMGTSDNRAEVKKSKSFASTLKRRFQRGDKKAKRSQSADRASTVRDASLLSPPGQEGSRLSDDLERSEVSSDYSSQSLKREPKRSSLRKLFRNKKNGTDDYDTSQTDIPEAGLQKNRQRSRSFSSSLKKLFKGKKKEGGVSRESSVSRQSTRSAQGALTLSRDGSAQHSPQMYRQSSPDQGSHDFPYSTSVPAGDSPLYDQYSAH